MVPVFNDDKTPLMPCSEKMARKRMERGTAKPYWRKGVFCIILQYHVDNPKFQKIVIGCDPGSKFEGFTAMTETRVIINIESLAATHVKKRVETRTMMRRSRRNRNTPYRKCRRNRKGRGLPPSTKARWQAKLRIVRFLMSMLPVTDVSVEDVCAVTKKGQKKWNGSFSQLQAGKWWFYEEINKLDVKLHLYQGYETKQHREERGFKKTSDKAKMSWEAHCVDSHSLCEMCFGTDMTPFRHFFLLLFLNFNRRQLHRLKFKKNGVRTRYGGTVSNGVKSGTLVRHPKLGLCFTSGCLDKYTDRIGIYGYWFDKYKPDGPLDVKKLTFSNKSRKQDALIDDLKMFTRISFTLMWN